MKLTQIRPVFKLPPRLYHSKKTMIAVALTALILGWGFFFSWWWQSSTRQEQITHQENEEIIADIAKIIQLPTEEEPVLATVADVQKLKDQVFFSQAKDGDKVLFFSQAKKAILYRPSEHKVIEVSSLNFVEGK